MKRSEGAKERGSRWRRIARRLAWIHRAYAWIVLFMALSGLLFYMPSLRGLLAPVRVPLVRAHVVLGVAGALLLVAYLAHAPAHWRTMGSLWGRRLNAVVAVLLAVGWAFSGVILWWDRAFMPWTSAALWWHGTLTWVGIPYLLGHALLRWRRIDLRLPWARPRPKDEADFGSLESVALYHRMQAAKRRRLFLSTALRLGTLAAGASLLAYFQRDRLPWGGSQATAGAAAAYDPLPEPSPLSSPPVGGGARGRFRIYNVARAPFRYDAQSWRLTVNGLVNKPLALTWPEVAALPRDVWVRDFHCVSGWSVYNVTWEGIPLSTVLATAGVRPEATHVKFYSYDGVYTDALTLDQAYLDDVILAVLKDGKPLTHDEGGPVRLVVGRMFGYKSVKWLSGVELIDEPHRGYWQRLGYSEDAWVPGMPRTGPLPKVRAVDGQASGRVQRS